MLKRDVGAIALGFFGLFLALQHEGTISFRKAWWVK
jgi:hypothetical protein